MEQVGYPKFKAKVRGREVRQSKFQAGVTGLGRAAIQRASQRSGKTGYPQIRFPVANTPNTDNEPAICKEEGAGLNRPLRPLIGPK